MSRLGVDVAKRFDLIVALVHELQIADAAFVYFLDALDATLQKLSAFGGLDDAGLAFGVTRFEIFQSQGTARTGGGE